MYRKISACRVCGNRDLVSILHVGEQALTGVFPGSVEEAVSVGPLELVMCSGVEACGLVQLRHSFSPEEMYGENYGYRSGLNPSMVSHLREKVRRVESYGLLRSGDLVLDIGSNDGTTLSLYQDRDLTLVGFDPTANKFAGFYPPGVVAVADFFSSDGFLERFAGRKAKVITSFSMFYDLEDPQAFVREIAEVLADDGIWVLEQSYMPRMLETNSYDTVCHEHLEYYALTQIDWILRRCGLQLVDVECNTVNGGSFSVTVQKEGGSLPVADSVQAMLTEEAAMGLDREATYHAFRERVVASRGALLDFLERARAEGKRVIGLGASTKGNVILQYCGIGTELIEAIGEVNPDKFGSVTPGTHIPIVDERELLASNPDYALVLPWHFRSFFEGEPRYDRVSLVFPLPVLEVRTAP